MEAIENFYKNKELLLGNDVLTELKNSDKLQKTTPKSNKTGGEKGDIAYDNYEINSKDFIYGQ